MPHLQGAVYLGGSIAPKLGALKIDITVGAGDALRSPDRHTIRSGRQHKSDKRKKMIFLQKIFPLFFVSFHTHFFLDFARARRDNARVPFGLI